MDERQIELAMAKLMTPKLGELQAAAKAFEEDVTMPKKLREAAKNLAEAAKIVAEASKEISSWLTVLQAAESTPDILVAEQRSDYHRHLSAIRRAMGQFIQVPSR